MLSGAPTIKIHGSEVPVKAEVAMLDMLSAHADWQETLDWLQGFEAPPRRTFITHGEPSASDALRLRIAQQGDWDCYVPDYLESQSLHL